MPKFMVTVPVVAAVTVELEADSAQEAIDFVLAHLSGDLGNAFKLTDDDGKIIEDLPVFCDEWEAHDKIVEGNVVHTYHHTADAELVED